KELSKGNFLLFFIPGIILTTGYYWFIYQTSSIGKAITFTNDYTWFSWAIDIFNFAVRKTLSVFMIISEQFYIFFILTLLSPFNTYLGEKLDAKHTGAKFEGGIIRFLHDFIRMVFVVILAISLEIICIVFYWVLSWFIGFEPLDTIIYFCITAFFFGFSFYDFALERYKSNVFDSLEFAFSKPLTMILTGSVFLIIFNIPYIGVPLAPVITLMVSTFVYLHLTNKIQQTPTNNKQNTIENE
ncbi:MAG: hypothetical protein P8N52_10140, partial [Crocinitomicaceae bacterium]|nr:hypothetical protein [Crocinitomicaceae bacterium]